MQINEAIRKGIKILEENQIEDASLTVRILLSSILICNKEELILKSEERMQDQVEEKFFLGIEKIAKGYPLQYLTHSKEFMKLNFYVDENVLVPRSDTETLAEEAIKIIKEENKKEILELCTGSGAIAISLKKYLEDIEITATDISKKALNVAKKNSKRLINNGKIKFVQSDMFKKINKKYDVIVSNPPYIKTDVIKEYNLEYEPKIALDGGIDGLNFYKIIINEGYKYLKNNGVIILEIGYDQKEEVINLAKNCMQYEKIECLKDLNGNDRVVILRKKEEA